MNIIFSVIYCIFLVLWSALIPIIYFPACIIRSSRIADHGAKTWSALNLWMLKKLCKIDHQIIGLDKLPKTPCIIACKHQSMWETMIMHLLLNRPAYIFKQELIKVPFYGWYLNVMSGIKLNRKGGASALKSMTKQSKHYLANNQSIVIFPQGTRVPVGAKADKYPYQAGIASLYLSCGVPVVPAALNSGSFWKKSLLQKKPGTIKLEFLDPIEPGLKKKEFLLKLEEETEKKSNSLN